ncbi:MAG: hypothetical protein ACR2L5_00800, partial [Candidatus Actinomarinaceae bacterium]
ASISEPKAKAITVTNTSKDTVLLETDSLDEVVKLVNEYDKHTYYDLPFFDRCLFDIKNLIPKDWENVSYGNDTCPSFEVKGLQIFIDNENPTEREIQDGKRFHIIKVKNYGLGYKPLLETDNFFEVLEFVNDN